MSEQPSEFVSALEAVEGRIPWRYIPKPVDPLQAQTAFERRARNEDYVAHTIAIIQTSGFFLLAFAALLGYVNISNAATATFLGTVMGYAVGKVDPILTRYFASRMQSHARVMEPGEVAPSVTPPGTPTASTPSS